MKRPLSNVRPIGPFAEKFTSFDINTGSDKEVIGVPGTPMPNIAKEDLLVIYILDEQGERVVFSDDFARDVERKINARGEFEGFTVKFLESGTSSAKPFKEQAILVTVPGEELAITDSKLDRVQGIIERQVDGVQIKERLYEMRGT